MSLFAKKTDAKMDARTDIKTEGKMDTRGDGAPDLIEPAPGAEGGPSYGIADAIRLMRSLPLEQNLDLIVRVVRVTLSSVNVRLEDIIEDASRRQKTIQDKIAALHAQVNDLQEQLETKRREIAAHEVDLKETTVVKERLQHAEKAGGRPPPTPGLGLTSLSASTIHPPPPPPSAAPLVPLAMLADREE